MDLIKILRSLIILQVGSGFLVGIAMVAIPTVGVEDAPDWSEFQLFALAVVIVLGLVSYLFLFLLKPVGKPLFVVLLMWEVLFVLVVPESTSPLTNLESLFNTVTKTIDGVILAMLFLSPLKETFRKQNEKSD